MLGLGWRIRLQEVGQVVVLDCPKQRLERVVRRIITYHPRFVPAHVAGRQLESPGAIRAPGSELARAVVHSRRARLPGRGGAQ